MELFNLNREILRSCKGQGLPVSAGVRAPAEISRSGKRF